MLLTIHRMGCGSSHVKKQPDSEHVLHADGVEVGKKECQTEIRYDDDDLRQFENEMIEAEKQTKLDNMRKEEEELRKKREEVEADNKKEEDYKRFEEEAALEQNKLLADMADGRCVTIIFFCKFILFRNQ